MQAITVTIREDQGIPRHQEPLSFGIPLIQGQIFDTQSLQLIKAGRRIPGQFYPAAHWTDGSVRWVHVTTHIEVAPHDCVCFTLTDDAVEQQDIGARPTDWITSSGTGWTLYTDTMIHTLDAKTGMLKSQALDEPDGLVNDHSDGGLPSSSLDRCWHLDFRLLTGVTEPAAIEIADRITWDVNAGPVSATVHIEGHWLTHDKQMLANYRSTLTFFRANGLVQVDYCLHNPKRALHTGGLWDLGDAGSIRFIESSARISGPSVTLSELKATPLGPIHQAANPCDAISLYQDSSGGENWDSVNHVNADGRTTTHFRGYRMVSAGDHCVQGLRAQPVAAVNTPSGWCSLAMRQFWQNCPSSLQAGPRGLTLGLFPQESGQHYELQGGERKTQRFTIGFGMPVDALAWTAKPLIPVVEARAYADAEAFDWFYPAAACGPLEALLKEHIQCPASLLEKRETIDEYGWRHFGDLVADHESLYQPDGEPTLVSHYNNQYDAIMAFARQFALTGDTQWFELMDDLARHVCDIDIYHTQEDRAEYNNGLFWHTDHYLPSHTATHRTFSRHNETSSTPGQTGGGPGAEHCYTTGLLLHHHMTGYYNSGAAVTELAEWMITVHDGSPGLLSQILACKKRDLPQLLQLLRRQTTSPYPYPFTRGTGNYLVSLVDAYTLNNDIRYLNRASQVVRQTCHPDDDVERRQLLDVENHWSYLILLSSLVHYITTLTKAERPELTADRAYALACLRTYTRWMVQHEQPFLAQAEELEFANDTWVAQDMRKVMLWYMASELDPAWAPRYHATAKRWLAEIVATLMASPTRQFTRIQIILLQQYGPHEVALNNLATEPVNLPDTDRHPTIGRRPALTVSGLLYRAFKRLCMGLLQCRPSRERAWLRTRLDRS